MYHQCDNLHNYLLTLLKACNMDMGDGQMECMSALAQQGRLLGLTRIEISLWRILLEIGKLDSHHPMVVCFIVHIDQ